MHQIDFGSFFGTVEVEGVFSSGLGETEIDGDDVGTAVGGECQGTDVAFFHDFCDFFGGVDFSFFSSHFSLLSF